MDGNGTVSANPDMLLLARYLLGFRGAALTNGLTLVGPRNAPSLIESYLKDDAVGHSSGFGSAVRIPGTLS